MHLWSGRYVKSPLSMNDFYGRNARGFYGRNAINVCCKRAISSVGSKHWPAGRVNRTESIAKEKFKKKKLNRIENNFPQCAVTRRIQQ